MNDPTNNTSYFYIYGLYSSNEPYHVRYVGRATGKRRPIAPHGAYIEEWKQQQEALGYTVDFYRLENLKSPMNLSKRERYWQSKLISEGHLLLNKTKCGAGGERYSTRDVVEYEFSLCLRYINGDRTKDLAKEENCSITKIANILKSFGVALSKKRRSFLKNKRQLSNLILTKNRLIKEIEDRASEWSNICDRYSAGEDTVELAKQFGVSHVTIGNILNRNGIIIRDHSKAKSGLSTVQEDEICKRYEAGLNSVELSKIYNVSFSYVCNLIKRKGFEIRDPAENRLKIGRSNHQVVCQEYLSGKSMSEVALKFNVASATILNILRRNGVKSRTLREAHGGPDEQAQHDICQRYLNGESTYKLEKEIDLSEATIRKILKINGIKIRSKKEARALYLKTSQL